MECQKASKSVTATVQFFSTPAGLQEWIMIKTSLKTKIMMMSHIETTTTTMMTTTTITTTTHNKIKIQWTQTKWPISYKIEHKMQEWMNHTNHNSTMKKKKSSSNPKNLRHQPKKLRKK